MSARFSPQVEAVLRAAGWFPGRRLSAGDLATAHRAVSARTGRFGGRLPATNLADVVLAEFGGLTFVSDLPGIDLHPEPFAVDPTLAGRWIETLIDVSRSLGVELYPLGVEGFDEAVLAVTDRGSVIAIDEIGEWFLGGTIEEALDLLITGRLPRPTAPGDGRSPSPWAAPPRTDPDERSPLGSLKRPAGAAFFLPRTPSNLPYVWLPDVLVRIGAVPAPSPVDPGRFQIEQWGGVLSEVHALDLGSYTVLALAFEQDAALAQRADRPADLPPVIPVLSPLDHAFRNACAGLSPELEVAFLHTRQPHDLLRLVADCEPDVAALEGGAILDRGFHLAYVTDRVDYQIGPSLAAQPREEIPIIGGRLLRAWPGPDPARREATD